MAMLVKRTASTRKGRMNNHNTFFCCSCLPQTLPEATASSVRFAASYLSRHRGNLKGSTSLRSGEQFSLLIDLTFVR
jgi:hypothetical protein